MFTYNRHKGGEKIIKQTITNDKKILIVLTLLSLALVFTFCVSDVSAANDTIYVNESSGSDTNDGFSWATAKLSIKNATGTVNNGGTVNIADGTYTGAGNTGITISKNMNIMGQSHTGTIINGGGTAQIFNILSGVNVTIHNLTLTNGTATNGGAINNQGTLTLNNCTLSDNTAQNGATGPYGQYAGGAGGAGGSGGAIYSTGRLALTNCTLSNNAAGNGGTGGPGSAGGIGGNGGSGGAIFTTAVLTLTNCILSGNAAGSGGTGGNDQGTGGIGGSGGAIYTTATLAISNCTLINNAAGNGGNGQTSGSYGVLIGGGNGNSGGAGGAIYTTATLTLTNSTLSYNKAGNGGNGGGYIVSGNGGYGGSGGAIYNTGTITVTNSTLSYNKAGNGGNGGSGSLSGGDGNLGGSGGAIFTSGTFNLSRCTLSNNQAGNGGNPGSGYFQGSYGSGGSGGAIYTTGIINGSMNYSRIVNNSATTGNAIYNIGSLTDATLNWWGSNTNPATISNLIGVNTGSVNTTTWVILTLNATPSTVNNGGTSTITADFNHVNGGGDLNGGSIPDGIPVTFTTAWGSFTQSPVTTVNGQATTTFQATGTISPNSNPVQVYARADNENSVHTPVNVIMPTTVTVNSAENFAGQNVTLTATVKDYYGSLVTSGNVIFIISNAAPVTVPVNAGVATLTWTIPSTWSIGNYPITVAFDGTGTNYFNSMNYGTLTVDQTPTNVTVVNVHNFAGQNVTLTANVKDYYNQPVNGGQVTFNVNGVNAGTSNLNGGSATLTWTIPSNWNIGTYTVTANFDGTGTNYGNSVNSSVLTVDQTPTNVTVVNVHSFAGQNVTLTANVTDYYTNSVNGGTVTFYVEDTYGNQVDAGTSNIDSSGIANLTWTIPSIWSIGNYPITVAFDGTGTNYDNSINSSILTVDQTPTTITADPVHNFAGQNVTLTANVTDYYGNLVNGGQVTFNVNGVNAGTANINSLGIANLTWTIPATWNIGNYPITVNFDGTGTNYVNSSNTGNLAVDTTPTNVNVINVHNFAGQNVTLTANVTDYYGYPVNEGSVKFTVNGINAGTALMNNGEATLNWTIPSDWSVGIYTILAEYIGTGNFNASNSTGNLTVDPTPTSVTVVNVTGVNTKTVTLNATLTDVYGHPLTDKTINFKINGTSIGTATTNSNGIATLNYKLNSAGNFTVTAEFAGDSEYINSTGNGTLTVDPSSDLYIKIISNKNNPKVSETFTITYKLGNQGPDNATNVTITVPLPKGFEVVNISGDGKWTYNANNNTITWTLTNVPVGDPYLYISGKVLSPGSYTFGSSISSETYNINSRGVTPITINAVPQVKASSATKTIGMQDTGLPLAGLILAILSVFSGLLTPKRK